MPEAQLTSGNGLSGLPGRPTLVRSFELAKAPWIRPGVVVHDPLCPVDELLAAFATDIRRRGFDVAGYIQGDTGDDYDLLDLASGEYRKIEGDFSAAAQSCLRKAMRDDADLVVIGRFPDFETAARSLKASVGKGGAQGMPVLTSIAGRHVHKWQDFAGRDGAMIVPYQDALWEWWGPERLYQDLALGVREDDVLRISVGPRWLMVQGPHGAGVAYLPQNPKELVAQLPTYRRASLRQLADLSQSWDPLEMAVGLAAINAHYNRSDMEGHLGGGAHLFRRETGRVVAVGVFPGVADILPNAVLIKHEPGPGDYPLEAMESLLPGCAGVVATASNIANRKLPRILRLSQGARTAVIGPGTPLTSRLFSYGVDLLGGLVITDPEGLAAAVRAGAQPRDFERFGHYMHLRNNP